VYKWIFILKVCL